MKKTPQRQPLMQAMWIVMLAILPLCGALAETSQRLTLTGSSTVAPLALEIAKRFEQRNPGVRVDVQSGGSSRGIADARSGVADIGMVSRDLTEAESDLHSSKIARDGIGIIVHESNPIKSFTSQQVVEIYTGKIKNWSQLNGKDQPITVVNKAEGRSTLELFLAYFALKNSDIKAQVIIGENEQGIKTVSGNPGAIGYVSIGAAEYAQANHVPIKLPLLAGSAASKASIQDGTFPLSRSLVLVTKEVPKDLAKSFIDFASSAQVNDIIEKQHFVPLAR